MKIENKLEKIKERFSKVIVSLEEKTKNRIYIEISPDCIFEIANFFKELNFRFAIASGVDTPSGIEILYHFSDDKSGKIITLRTLIKDKKDPKIQSITPIIKGAEWIEREIWELLGVNFVGHPNLKHLLLKDDWPEGKYPLRKEKNE